MIVYGKWSNFNTHSQVLCCLLFKYTKRMSCQWTGEVAHLIRSCWFVFETVRLKLSLKRHMKNLWNVSQTQMPLIPHSSLLQYYFQSAFISVSCSPTVLFMTYLLNNGQKKVYFLSFRCFICGRAVNTARSLKFVDDNSVCLILHV